MPTNKETSWNKGKHHSEETRKKMSAARKGRHCTEKTKHKLSLARTGDKNPMYGRTPWNKGKEGLSGEKNPMYGKTHTPEARLKISKTHKGRKIPQEQLKKRSISLKGIPKSDEFRKHLSFLFKGRKYSEDSIKRMSESKKGNKNPMFGKSTSDETKNLLRECNLGRKHTAESRKKMSVAKKDVFLGENNPNWQGGRSFDPYCSKFNDNLRGKIRTRDNHTCQLCNEKENGKTLSVHHVNHDRENCEPYLISLCRRCHGKVNRNKGYYEPFFMYILQSKGLLNHTHGGN